MKKIIVHLLLSFISSSYFAQGKLSGKVQDKETGKALSSANIFISELNSRTIADSNGNFVFNSLPSGKFHVQVSHIGYGSYVTLVKMSADVVLNVQLEMSAIETDEIVITAPYNSTGDNTAYTIDAVMKDEMRASGSLTLTGALCDIPGVNQLSLGSGITKPIIRGLRGNRVLTVLNGFRFDNQQWQDEHGLGLSDMGIDRVEVIKGPASVIYGSDAMGGVINLVEDLPAPIGKTLGAFSTKFNTNTLQAGGEFVLKGAKEKMNWKVNLGGESNTNYLDAKKDIAFNTRFNGSAFKFGIGFNHAKYVTSFNYNFSDYNFGFVDGGEFLKPNINYDEERFSRTMEDAYHIVQYHLFYNKTTFFLKNSRLVLDAGAHLNHRTEHEDAAHAEYGNMDMKLNNYSMNFKWIKSLGERTEMIAGTQDMFQTNTNYGQKYVIPDAGTEEFSGYLFMKHSFTKLIIEEGIRGNLYTLSTLEHGNKDSLIANMGGWMPAFDRSYTTFSGSLGFVYLPVERLLFKLNLSSGFRAPNLAELSANGFHEGFTYYEQGDKDLANEQNFEADLSVRYGTGDLKIEAAAFYDDILNYIYLDRTDSIFQARFIYRYKQTDALLFGGEAGFDWEPSFAKWLDIKSNYCTLTAYDANDEFLPFMPADRIRSEVKFRFRDTKKLSDAFVQIAYTNVFKQARIAISETITSCYSLLDISMGGELKGKKLKAEISLFCNNLLNAYYYDHLSLVKPGTMPGGKGFYGMGRNTGVVIRFPFGK